MSTEQMARLFLPFSQVGGYVVGARVITLSGVTVPDSIASTLAAEIYGLDILDQNIEDAEHNTTRFLIMSRETEKLPADWVCPVCGAQKDDFEKSND